MAENIGVNIVIGGNATEQVDKLNTGLQETEKSVGSLKAQLRAAQNEVGAMADKFGATSVEAVNAAKKAAELKDRIGDAKALTDAFNPDAKFKSLTSSLSGLAGGFAAVQGGISLLGVESKDVEKALLKVQSAMAISQGLQAVGESIDSFKQLKTVIVDVASKAFGSLKAAIISTGVGALAIALGLVIANFDEVKRVILNLFPGLGKLASYVGGLVEKFTDLIGVTSAAERGLDKLSKANARTNEDIEAKIKLLSAQGGKEKEIHELKQTQVNNELNLMRESSKVKGKMTDEELKKFRELKNNQLIEGASFDKQQNDAAKERADKQLAIDKKLAEDQKKQREQNRKDLNAYYDGRLKFEEDKAKEKKAKEDAILELAAKETEKEDKDLEDKTNKEIKAAILVADKKNTIESNLLSSQLELQKANGVQSYEADFELFDKKAELSREDLVRKQATADELLTFDNQTAVARIKLEEQVKDAKISVVNAGLNAVADAVGRDTAAGKALSVASAVINTYQGATKALATYPPPFGAIAAGATVLTGMMSVKKIISTPLPGIAAAGGGASVSMPSLSAAAPLAPPTPQAQTTTLSSQTIGQLGNQAVRAYVVENDVTSNQERISAIKQRARFG
ncbi:MAG: hypothetical protein D4R41_01645 [Sediminibacterium sp.]|nr:MAG: hypothetical protein D4R41_01645 [Sediminibacterium sp.]